MTNEKLYPATVIVHCPNGPVPACESHADQIQGLMRFMGAHTVRTLAEPGMVCSNCVNENKSGVYVKGENE